MKALRCLFLFMLSLLVLAGCGLSAGQSPAAPTAPAVPQALTSFEAVASYIQEHHKLPDNFITKEGAKKLGWDPQKGNLNKVAPGKSIGGDVFQNREGKLPSKKGRVWYEADINYKSGQRGKDRVLFSNDGLIYKTEDHYETFTPIK
ncbi:Ribonuclease precursor [Paenibacillus konkukensis]|uniref:Ribonuclease n=2 Tax=Paenibacillus TaxID=44249 RepID=A0ABY4RI37_9BACL|nr:Ribonuclease precursor [Paenibacillus konkukensis]